MKRATPDPRQAERLRAMNQDLAARRKEMRAELKAKLERRRKGAGGKDEDKRRRRWWLLVVLVIIALLLLRNCSCSPPPPPEEEPAAAQPVQAAGEPVVAPPVPEPITGRVERRDRPEYDSEPPIALPWLGSFRMQVAARSPRLAECFVGANRPGTLKWTASVEPGEGRVSDHSLEPTLRSDALTRQQRECVIAVLSDPPYRLQTDEERSTPSRVGMVIEF